MKQKRTNENSVRMFEETNGRQYIIIEGEKAYVDLLAAKTFLYNPNPEIYTEVEHIDGDMSNNAAANLRWVTDKNFTNTQKGQDYE